MLKYLAVVTVSLLGCDGTIQPPEPPLPPAQLYRLVAGPLGLVGRTTTTCSHGTGKSASADVWCAFHRSTAQGTDLWVLNVSQAVKGGVTCDGGSPHCLRLTATLWTGGPVRSQAHPGIHGFEGDTLFIYADARTTRHDDSYRGPIQAWRPGWPRPRAVSTSEGFLCHGSVSAATAYCLDGVVATSGNFELDVLAGSLAGMSTGALASAGRIRALGSEGQLMWGATLSPDGQYLLLSSPADGQDVEVLRSARLTDGGLAAPTEVLRGIARWRLAPDGKKLYYLKDFNYDTNPSGTLTMADFPSVANPIELQAKVGLYAPLGGDFGEPDRGLGYLQDIAGGGGTFRILRDRNQPAQALTLDTGVNEFLVSPDLRHTYLGKVTSDTGPMGLLARNDGGGLCTVNTRDGTAVYLMAFSPDSSSFYWAQDAEVGFQIDGFYAGTDGCANPRRFSTNLAYLAPFRGGLLYADSDPDRQTMTLRRADLVEGVLQPEGGTVVRAQIDNTIARAGRYHVFTVSRGDENEEGLYAFGPLP